MGGERRTMDWTAFNWSGLFLLLLGVAWLGDTMHWWTFNWTMVGPLALIFAGFMVFIGRKR